MQQEIRFMLSYPFIKYFWVLTYTPVYLEKMFVGDSVSSSSVIFEESSY